MPFAAHQQSDVSHLNPLLIDDWIYNVSIPDIEETWRVNVYISGCFGLWYISFEEIDFKATGFFFHSEHLFASWDAASVH